MTQPDVIPAAGQVWADTDPRNEGRSFLIDSIDGGTAICTILTNATETQRGLDGKHAPWRPASSFRDTRGKETRIAVRRLKPGSTGYRCIRDTQYGVRWPTGTVFPFRSRRDAEDALCEDGRNVGALVACEYAPTAHRLPGEEEYCGDWYLVEG